MNTTVNNIVVNKAKTSKIDHFLSYKFKMNFNTKKKSYFFLRVFLRWERGGRMDTEGRRCYFSPGLTECTGHLKGYSGDGSR